MGERGAPRLTADQVIGTLKHHGFLLVGQSGSHQKWRNATTGKQVIVAFHRGRVLPLGTMRSIIEGSGIPRDEWMR
ncbi:MAG: type II toxin-antitoxin system HicA family toxin [Acidobacteriaceae bacterium]|nr:type II toxin-antitoxin system HicA family toxin [Acidobacteriaceae bacterium]